MSTRPRELEKVSDLDAGKLTAWMTANVAGFVGPIAYAKFPGGQSNPTYRIDCPSGPYVLRRKPFGPLLPSAHAVDREYRLIQGLHPTGFPVARPYGLCEDEGVIGAPFYVMELIEGVTYWNGALPEQTPAERDMNERRHCGGITVHAAQRVGGSQCAIAILVQPRDDFVPGRRFRKGTMDQDDCRLYRLVASCGYAVQSREKRSVDDQRSDESDRG